MSTTAILTSSPTSAPPADGAVAAWVRGLGELDAVTAALVTLGRGRERAAELLGGHSVGTPLVLLTDTAAGSTFTSAVTALHPLDDPQLHAAVADMTAGGRGPLELLAADVRVPPPGWTARGTWKVVERPAQHRYTPPDLAEGVEVALARDHAEVVAAAAVAASHGDAADATALDLRLLADGAGRVLVGTSAAGGRGVAVAVEVEGVDTLLGVSAGGDTALAGGLVRAWSAQRPFVPAVAALPPGIAVPDDLTLVGPAAVARLDRW